MHPDAIASKISQSVTAVTDLKIIATFRLTRFLAFARVAHMKKYTEGEVLKDLRERLTPPRGVTQKEVAVKLGMSVQYLYQVLNGQRPISENLAGALGFRRMRTMYTRSLPE